MFVVGLLVWFPRLVFHIFIFCIAFALSELDCSLQFDFVMHQHDKELVRI